jgi:hypothetical protein
MPHDLVMLPPLCVCFLAAVLLVLADAAGLASPDVHPFDMLRDAGRP